MKRITLSVNHSKINAYAHRLNSMERVRLMRAIDDGARLAVFNVNEKLVTLSGAYGLCERCLDLPGVNDGYAVDRPGEWLCNECLAELWSDNCLPSIFVVSEPVAA